jgi:hypothetical protein
MHWGQFLSLFFFPVFRNTESLLVKNYEKNLIKIYMNHTWKRLDRIS